MQHRLYTRILCFQISHAIRMIKVLSLFFLKTLGSPLIALHHELEKRETEGSGAQAIRPSLSKMTAQTCLQRMQRDDGVLNCFIHLITEGAARCGSPSKAISFPTSVAIASQMKNLQCSGIQLFQMHFQGANLIVPNSPYTTLTYRAIYVSCVLS